MRTLQALSKEIGTKTGDLETALTKKIDDKTRGLETAVNNARNALANIVNSTRRSVSDIASMQSESVGLLREFREQINQIAVTKSQQMSLSGTFEKFQINYNRQLSAANARLFELESTISRQDDSIDDLRLEIEYLGE